MRSAGLFILGISTHRGPCLGGLLRVESGSPTVVALRSAIGATAPLASASAKGRIHPKRSLPPSAVFGRFCPFPVIAQRPPKGSQAAGNRPFHHFSGWDAMPSKRSFAAYIPTGRLSEGCRW